MNRFGSRSFPRSDRARCPPREPAIGVGQPRPSRVRLALVFAAAFLLGSVASPDLFAQQNYASPHGQLDIPCATCHTSDGWKPARVPASFEHRKFGFPLEQAHGAVTCTSCHQSLEFKQVQKTCAGCHQDVHRGELGLDCAQCHNTRAFTDRSGFTEMHALTRFPLEGVHRAVDCRSCHAPGSQGTLVFRGAPTDCVACHQGAYTRTVDPNHPAAKFATNCPACHTGLVTWAGATYDHQTTRFPLTGAHRSLTCQQCHADNLFDTKPIACVACHQASFDKTAAPPHRAAGFPQDCTTCHTTATWQGAPYDHNATKFPLTGAHQALTCDQCHQDGVFVGKPTTCVACHQPAYTNAKQPPHAGFPIACASCHTTATWQGATFDHQATQFPLTGKHIATTCQQCHADAIYKGKPTTCVSCHQTDYSGTTNPKHQAAGFSTTCTHCHTTATWVGAVFDHQTTNFPLTGAHQAAACQQCHADGVYNGKPTACVSCHQTDYGKTVSPPHQAAGFATTCATCHTTVTWTGARFDHNTTPFPLTGAHMAATCQQCHPNNVYKGRPQTCVSCHQTDWTGTNNPPHQSAGFPTTCVTCHSTSTWLGAVFDHNTTPFPLTGAHQAATCQQCHSSGVYKGLPTTCVSCHQTDYNTTTNPNHQGASFPTTCSTCHTTTTWLGATFNHDGPYFPIYSGKHRGQWSACSDCHTNAAAFTVFTCLTCHEHNKASMDSKHQGRSGYTYQSTACYSCHPRGQAN